MSDRTTKDGAQQKEAIVLGGRLVRIKNAEMGTEIRYGGNETNGEKGQSL